MIVALDTNCILPGRVGGIESYVIGIIEALLDNAPWVRRLILLTREENDELFRSFQCERCSVILQNRPILNGKPITNWAQALATHPEESTHLLHQFQQDKLRLLQRERADVVHFPGGALNPMRLNLPAVLTLHDLQHRRFPHYFTDAERRNRETYWIESARCANAVVTSSDFTAADMAHQLELSPNKLFVATPAVRRMFHDPPHPDVVNTVRHKLQGVSRFLLYPAAPFAHKNHQRLLKAFASIRHDDGELSKTHLILTGGGQAESNLPQMVVAMELQDRVHLMGRVSDAELRALYSLATGMIFPSEYEGCGLPLIEAMAAGCPVAASNIASIPEIVGDAAVLFDPSSEAAIADAMRDLVTNESLRHDHAMRGHERAGQYTTARFAQQLKGAYDAAIAAYSPSAADVVPSP